MDSVRDKLRTGEVEDWAGVGLDRFSTGKVEDYTGGLDRYRT